MMHGHSLSNVGDWERGHNYETAQDKFQAGMQALSTASENCTKVTGRLGWTIQISSDYPLDLSWLAERSTQFFGGSSVGNKSAWQQKLHNPSREFVAGCWRLAGKNWAFFPGSWQWVTALLVKKTAQLLGCDLWNTSAQFLRWAGCWVVEALFMKSTKFSR